MPPQSEVLDQLAERLDALERRVSGLERRSAPATDVVSPHPEAPQCAATNGLQSATLPPPLAARAKPSPTESVPSGGALPVFGKALLGIAGAYLLRALASASFIPRGLVIALAIVYAAAWLFAASRTVEKHRFAGVLYAAASLLILAPMLWEMTLRFHAMPAWVAAIVVALYASAATILAKGDDRSAVFSLAYTGTALTSLALLVGTHDMVPFVAILFAMTVMCEIGRFYERAAVTRILVTLAADLAVWIVLYLYRLPAGPGTDYPALPAAAILALPIVLFLLQSGWIVIAVGVRARSIAVFDVVQSSLAFVLLTAALLWFAPAIANRLLSVLCLGLAAVCYSATFLLFEAWREPRNLRVFSTWAALLLLGGTYLLVAPTHAAIFLGIAALVAIVLAERLQATVLEWHGLLFLVIATVTSGLLDYCGSALAGPMPPFPAWQVLVVAACAVLCYLLSHEFASEPGQKQFLHLVPAFLSVVAVAAFLIRAAFSLAKLLVTPEVFHVALVRTLILALLALGLAFLGARLHRRQMVRVAYVATAFVAAKLLFEDIRHGRLEFIAASICLVAVTLIAVPRLARNRRMLP